ncbi:MAG: response regulator [Ponticaulis sp.]|nr:response regulator [Ponticaulis sp.]
MNTASVILVEDDADVRRSLAMMLRSRGFSVQQYSNGPEMLASRHIPDTGCLLLDYRMPHMNGLQLFKHYRERGGHSPAILITGDFSRSVKRDAALEGIFAVIEKPITGEDLVSQINLALLPSTPNAL